MKTIETLTPEQAVMILRNMGMRISPTTMRKGLEQGVYPFGVYIETGNGHPVFQIYKKLFDKWVDERASEELANLYEIEEAEQ